MTSYIGRRITLVDSRQGRYEGILESINQDTSTIVLSNVRSFGTEGRNTSTREPPSPLVLNSMNFHKSQIQDLIVIDTQGENDLQQPPIQQSQSQAPFSPQFGYHYDPQMINCQQYELMRQQYYYQYLQMIRPEMQHQMYQPYYYPQYNNPELVPTHTGVPMPLQVPQESSMRFNNNSSTNLDSLSSDLSLFEKQQGSSTDEIKPPLVTATTASKEHVVAGKYDPSKSSDFSSGARRVGAPRLVPSKSTSQTGHQQQHNSDDNVEMRNNLDDSTVVTNPKYSDLNASKKTEKYAFKKGQQQYNAAQDSKTKGFNPELKTVRGNYNFGRGETSNKSRQHNTINTVKLDDDYDFGSAIFNKILLKDEIFGTKKTEAIEPSQNQIPKFFDHFESEEPESGSREINPMEERRFNRETFGRIATQHRNQNNNRSYQNHNQHTGHNDNQYHPGNNNNQHNQNSAVNSNNSRHRPGNNNNARDKFNSDGSEQSRNIWEYQNSHKNSNSNKANGNRSTHRNYGSRRGGNARNGIGIVFRPKASPKVE